LKGISFYNLKATLLGSTSFITFFFQHPLAISIHRDIGLTATIAAAFTATATTSV
jgi:hypothetical protein